MPGPSISFVLCFICSILTAVRVYTRMKPCIIPDGSWHKTVVCTSLMKSCQSARLIQQSMLHTQQDRTWHKVSLFACIVLVFASGAALVMAKEPAHRPTLFGWKHITQLSLFECTVPGTMSFVAHLFLPLLARPAPDWAPTCHKHILLPLQHAGVCMLFCNRMRCMDYNAARICLHAVQVIHVEVSHIE